MRDFLRGLARLPDGRIPDGQGGRALRLFLLVFAQSAALVLLKAAQSGIFLSAYDKSEIPSAFLVSAIVLATLSSAQVALMPRTGPLAMTTGTLAAGAVSAVVAFAGLFSGHTWVPFALYVGIEALSGLLIIQVWAVASGALDPRAAKRILPLCGIASSLAWAVGGALAGPVSGTLGAPALLLVSSVFLALSAGLTWVVARVDYRGRVVKRRSTESLVESWLGGLTYVRRVPLMRIAAALAVLALLAELFMDYALMSVAKERYTAPEELAAFFGSFFSVTSALSMVVLVVGSSRVLQSLGASRALLAMPVVIVIGGGAAALSGAFLPVVVMRGAARVLKQSLWGNSLEQTQTPLPVLQRSQGRALVRGVLAPLGYAALAGALAVLPADVGAPWLAAGAGICALLMAAIIVVRMRPAYLEALHKSLDERRLDLEKAPARSTEGLDKDTLAVMAAEVESTDVGRASLAVELLGALVDGSLEQRGQEEAVSLLVTAARHPVPQVRRVAVAALGRVTRAAEASTAADAAAERLVDDASAEVRLEAARALRRLPFTSIADAATRAGSLDPEADVRATCRVARLEREGPTPERLARLLDDDECRDVALTAVTPALAASPEVSARLGALLAAVDAKTRIAALRCVRRLKLMPLLPDAVGLLEDPRCAVVAATEIASWGEDATAILASIARFSGGETDGSFFKMARARWAERAYPVLIRLLAHRDPVVRQGAGRVLCGLVGVGSPEPLLRLEVDRIFHCYGILAGLAFGDGTRDWRIEGPLRTLGDEIELHIRSARDRLLQLLYLLDEERLMRAVEVGLRRPDPRLAAQVAELLELTLEARLARRIVPLFDSLSLRERVEAARRVRALDERALTDPLSALVELGDPHLRRFAMLVYGDDFRRRFAPLWEEEQAVLALYDRMRFLRSAPLFASLGGEDLRSVAEIVEQLDLSKGEVIFKEGDPGDNLFLVVAGQVAVNKDGHAVATLGEKDVLGELAVLDQEPRSADAVAATDVRLLRLRAADLEELIARRPQIQSAIVQVLVKRLRSTLQVAPERTG